MGKQKHDIVLIQRALEAHHAALTVWTKDKNPWDWSMSKHNLGETLIRINDIENKYVYLEKAKDNINDALKIRTQDKFPSAWAATLNNFGVVLFKLVENQSSIIYLKQALMAFSASNSVLCPENAISAYSECKINLKNALKILTIREDINECIEEVKSALPYLFTLVDDNLRLKNLKNDLKSKSAKCEKLSPKFSTL